MRSFAHARLGLFLLLFLLVCSSGLGLTTSFRGVAQAVNPPHIWLSNKVAPPTASVQLNGGGFGQSEMVNVDFDATPIARATTDSTGKFAIRITIPKMALPGSHIIQATGQASGLTAQTAFLVRTNWAQFRFGPYHTGNNPYENVINSSNVSTLTLDWRYTTGGGNSSPAVVNGVVYIGSTFPQSLYALDAVTGVLKWSYATGGYIGSSPAIVNGMIYLGSDDHKLYAFDAMTGALKWSYTSGGSIFSSPAVANGVVYFGVYGGELYAFDAITGKFKWSYHTVTYGGPP